MVYYIDAYCEIPRLCDTKDVNSVIHPHCEFLFRTAVGSDVNKDLGLKAKTKAKDSRYQGQIFHRSSPYIIFSSLALCECFYVRVLHFVSLCIKGYVIAVNDN